MGCCGPTRNKRERGSIMLTIKDCVDLSHQICKSFYHGRENEFEVWKNKKVPSNEKSVMYFYDNQTTAFLCFNKFKSKFKTSLAWREYNYTVGKSKKLNWSEEWILIVENPKKVKDFN